MRSVCEIRSNTFEPKPNWEEDQHIQQSSLLGKTPQISEMLFLQYMQTKKPKSVYSYEQKDSTGCPSSYVSRMPKAICISKNGNIAKPIFVGQICDNIWS